MNKWVSEKLKWTNVTKSILSHLYNKANIKKRKPFFPIRMEKNYENNQKSMNLWMIRVNEFIRNQWILLKYEIVFMQ